MQKYRNTKVTFDGVTYDSKKEYRRFCELSMLEKAGEITDLRRQVEYELIPVQREPDTIGKRGGLKKGKLIEHKVTYTADFVYIKNSKTVVEDVKSPATRKDKAYILKRKMMLYFYGIRIREV